MTTGCGHILLHLSAINALCNIFQLLQGFPDTKVIGEHMKKIGNFVLSEGFPRGRQLNEATDYVEYIAKVE